MRLLFAVTRYYGFCPFDIAAMRRAISGGDVLDMRRDVPDMTERVGDGAAAVDHRVAERQLCVPILPSGAVCRMRSTAPNAFP